MRQIYTLLLALVLALPAAAAELGEDGLHKADWMRETFKDLSEDLEEAKAEGQRLVVIFEQRGCIYCTRMHEEVFPDPRIDALLREEFFVVQMNLFGDVEVTDFDGDIRTEKAMAQKWGVLFTPTILFMPEDAPEAGLSASEAAVVTMPGAFGKLTTLNMLAWVLEKGYLTDENFQRYHARRLEELQATE